MFISGIIRRSAITLRCETRLA